MLKLNELPKRPSAQALCRLVDDLVKAHDASEETAADLRAKKAELDVQIRAADATCEAIKAYALTHLKRLNLQSAAGDLHKAETGQAAPRFTFDGEAEDIPDEFARTKRELDKALCKSAYDRGELPDSIQATRTEYVKFVRA